MGTDWPAAQGCGHGHWPPSPHQYSAATNKSRRWRGHSSLGRCDGSSPHGQPPTPASNHEKPQPVIALLADQSVLAHQCTPGESFSRCEFDRYPRHGSAQSSPRERPKLACPATARPSTQSRTATAGLLVSLFHRGRVSPEHGLCQSLGLEVGAEVSSSPLRRRPQVSFMEWLAHRQ